nr:cytokinin hydroxylase-like [Arachis hypogaea]
MVLIVTYAWWISPIQTHNKLKRCGFGGPTPCFPLGNIQHMKNIRAINNNDLITPLTHDIHSHVSPYFSSWQKSFGKVFVYWLGTEPFLYIADAEFLKKMSKEVEAKRWGKPSVFRDDREAMFGTGLVMVEGNDWVRHRHIVAPAFNPIHLKPMLTIMLASTNKMVQAWLSQLNSASATIDVERDIVATAGDIIARTILGIMDDDDHNATQVFRKLRALQMTLFNTNRYVGVPFGKYFNVKKTLEAYKLGKEIDELLLSIIQARMSHRSSKSKSDLLGLLLQENGDALTMRELVDECKTFFFGGHETTALSITWTLLLLAMHQDWQNQLRDEIQQLLARHNHVIDLAMLSGLTKMKWVMNEALRLYPPSPNVQRQAREDIEVKGLIVPKGTNMWIDVVAMHHDPELWGEDANEFKPERFMEDVNGGCKHKMGYLPFGFGGRMCVGRNLTFMEYKIVLTLLLSNFSFNISPTYHHSPSIMLSLRPTHGLPLILQPL